MDGDKQINNLGTYYSIPASMASKYRGCGNGRIIVQKSSNRIIDFSYLDENDEPIGEQNIAMHPDAGEILDENEHYITYRANFSCFQACLF